MANIFTDNFNRSNSTNLGSNWTQNIGSLEVNNNLLDNVSTTECLSTVTGVTISPSDYSVSADLSISTGTNNSGIVARLTDTSNYYHLRILVGTGVQLYSKTTASGLSLIGSYSTTISGATVYTVKLELSGSTINGYIGGSKVITVTNSDHSSAGKAGIRINNGLTQTGQVDNFSIDELTVSIITGSKTDKTEQQIFNLLYGSSETQYTTQEIANIYHGTPKTQYSLQNILNIRLGQNPTLMTVQEALYYNLSAKLGLTGSNIDYSPQELLNLAYLNNLTLTDIFT